MVKLYGICERALVTDWCMNTENILWENTAEEDDALLFGQCRKITAGASGKRVLCIRNNNFGCFHFAAAGPLYDGRFSAASVHTFLIVVGIVALISAVQKYLYKRNREDEYESEYERSRTYGNSGNRSYPEEDVDYSEVRMIRIGWNRSTRRMPWMWTMWK